MKQLPMHKGPGVLIQTEGSELEAITCVVIGNGLHVRATHCIVIGDDNVVECDASTIVSGVNCTCLPREGIKELNIEPDKFNIDELNRRCVILRHEASYRRLWVEVAPCQNSFVSNQEYEMDAWFTVDASEPRAEIKSSLHSCLESSVTDAYRCHRRFSTRWFQKKQAAEITHSTRNNTDRNDKQGIAPQDLSGLHANGGVRKGIIRNQQLPPAEQTEKSAYVPSPPMIQTQKPAQVSSPPITEADIRLRNQLIQSIGDDIEDLQSGNAKDADPAQKTLKKLEGFMRMLTDVQFAPNPDLDFLGRKWQEVRAKMTSVASQSSQQPREPTRINSEKPNVVVKETIVKRANDDGTNYTVSYQQGTQSPQQSYGGKCTHIEYDDVGRWSMWSPDQVPTSIQLLDVLSDINLDAFNMENSCAKKQMQFILTAIHIYVANPNKRLDLASWRIMYRQWKIACSMDCS